MIFARDGSVLAARFDIEVTKRDAEATIVVKGLPRWKHAPISVEKGDDVLAVARKLFAAGCLMRN
jgi:hypothetical protein